MNRFVAAIVMGMNLVSSLAVAESPATYFRVWEGYKNPSLTQKQLMNEFPPFMTETVNLYQGKALSNYIVVIPPKEKPAYIPDELALVALTSEAEYRKIRETPEGKAYGERHWHFFNKETSKSATQFVDYSNAPPTSLASGTAYDMIGKSIDWADGYTMVFIGLRRKSVSEETFLSQLKTHIELARDQFLRHGVRGYIVTAHENYEVAYVNWPSKEAHDAAMKSREGKLVAKDGNKLMDPLMYEPAKPIKAGSKIGYKKAYSTVTK